MPTIDFKCGRCDHKFEELVFGSDMERVKCPICESRDLSRVYEGTWMCGVAKGSRGCEGKSCVGCSGCKH